jgi:hypothetical protein
LNDEGKYLIFHYRYKKKDPNIFKELLESIENENIRKLIQIEHIEYLLQNGKIQQAFNYFQTIDTNAIHPELKERVDKLKYGFAIYGIEENFDFVNVGHISTNHPFYLYDRLYFLKKELDVRDTVQMDSLYNILATWNPFYENGIIAAVEYFHNDRNKDNYAYNLLVNALTVNAYSILLNEYYINYCLEDGLIDFAKNRVAFMREFMDPEEFKGFFKNISSDIARKEDEMNKWGS